MPQIDVTVPDSAAAVLVAAGAVSVAVPDSAASVLLASPSVDVAVPASTAAVICDDALASTFTAPTLVDWHLVASDMLALGARVAFSDCTTDGSPCRVKFTLHHDDATKDYGAKYSSPEQNTPHANGFDITVTADRGRSYDLYWSWTSGNESGGPTLVAAGAVYVPLNGEGDFPAEA